MRLDAFITIYDVIFLYNNHMKFIIKISIYSNTVVHINIELYLEKFGSIQY